MNGSGSLGIKLSWWLAGGCLLVVMGLVCAGTGAALGWAVFGARTASDTAGLAAAPDATARLRGNPVGQRAPAFTLNDVAGNELSLSDVRGRPVLINFWATWCGPCRVEMPLIEAAYQRHNDAGLVVLAIDVEENPELAKTFAGWLGVTFTILDDGTGDVAYRYRVTAFPTTFFVDRDGVIQAWQVGAMDGPALERHLAAIVKP